MNSANKRLKARDDGGGRTSWPLVLLIVTAVGMARPAAPAHAQSSGFVYVANNTSNNVSAYTIDGMSGALTTVAGSPFPAGAHPQGIAATAWPREVTGTFRLN